MSFVLGIRGAIKSFEIATAVKPISITISKENYNCLLVEMGEFMNRSMHYLPYHPPPFFPGDYIMIDGIKVCCEE